MTYEKSNEQFELHIYRPGEEWHHVVTYKNRGDQLLGGAKVMDEGYDFDGNGNKVEPSYVEMVVKEVLSKKG